MFVTQLWAVQSYPVEKEVLGVTLDTSEDEPYLRKNWSDSHKTKTKYTDGILGLKFGHQ